MQTKFDSYIEKFNALALRMRVLFTFVLIIEHALTVKKSFIVLNIDIHFFCSINSRLNSDCWGVIAAKAAPADLPDRLQQSEKNCSDNRAKDAATYCNRPHAVIDAASPAMRQHARNARASYLCGGRRCCDCRRNSIEDKQRRGQEASAHPEKPRQDTCDRAQQHNQKPVHRQVCDRQIDGQDIFHKERPSPAAPRFKVATSREPI